MDGLLNTPLAPHSSNTETSTAVRAFIPGANLQPLHQSLGHTSRTLTPNEVLSEQSPDDDSSPHTSVLRFEQIMERSLCWKDDKPIEPWTTKAFTGPEHPLYYYGVVNDPARGSGKAPVVAMGCHLANREEREAVAVKYCSKTAVSKELQMLKDVRHPHIISLMGSYLLNTQPADFMLILWPLTRYNLWNYLISPHKLNESCLLHPNADYIEHERIPKLFKFFRCLASALLYLHKHDIKHKDLKAENILICGYDNAIITDFDIANRYVSVQESVTSGPTRFTVKYASEEAFTGADRPYSSDVFSLGCVFLEMITVVMGETLSNLYARLGFQDQKVIYWQACAELKTQYWLTNHLAKRLQTIREATGDGAKYKTAQRVTFETLERTSQMVSREPDDRPSLQEVIDTFSIDKSCDYCAKQAVASTSSSTHPQQPRSTVAPPRSKSPPPLETLNENSGTEKLPTFSNDHLSNILASNPPALGNATANANPATKRDTSLPPPTLPNFPNEEKPDSQAESSTVGSLVSQNEVSDSPLASNTARPLQKFTKRKGTMNWLIYNPRKKERNIIHDINMIPGKFVVLTTKEENYQEWRVVRTGSLPFNQGVVMPLPGWLPGLRRKCRTPFNDVNLWNRLKARDLWKLYLPHTKCMAFGDVDPDEFLITVSEEKFD